MISVATLRDALLATPRVRITGAGTKPALSAVPDDARPLDLSSFTGITEYQPGEFTFTARAGTPLREIEETLRQHGQFLPFDPPLVAQGATLGGTIAAGLSGSGRLRYGGLRDFVIGARFLTGDGREIHGGGKVVKNAAGFDFPKLLVGSAGRLGVILEATFKVFPRPQEMKAACARTRSLTAALALLDRLVRFPADLDALDLEPDGSVWIRLAGDHGTLDPRLERLSRTLESRFEPAAPTDWPGSRIGHALTVKVPVTPDRIPDLDASLSSLGLPRLYTVAGHTAWIGITHEQAPALDAALHTHALPGLSLAIHPATLGPTPPSQPMALVRSVFDPTNRFV